MSETWRPVPGWAFYEVSDAGRVRSLPRVVPSKNGSTQRRPGKILKNCPNGRYCRVTLRDGPDRVKVTLVQHLVARAFHGPRPAGLFVCHRNGDGFDNRAENLYYGTPSENMQDKIHHGNNFQVEKEACPRGHALTGLNLDPSQLLRRGRSCWSCHKAWMAAQVPGRSIEPGELADRIYPIVLAGEWPERKGQIKKLMATLVAT